MDIEIITTPIPLQKIKDAAQISFGDMAKAVVDIQTGILALGGEWHADAEAILLENGSSQENLWGINIYPDLENEERIIFVSLINIRPRQNNRGMEIQNPEIRKKISQIVNQLIL
jgi:hypothetical protein